MAATRKLWRGLALWAAALGLGAPGLAVADENGDRCGAHIRGVLYPASVGDEGSPDFPPFEAWLCTRDFVAHEQALREGLAPGTEVYGTALEPRGKFSAGQRAAWKREHCRGERSARAIDQAEAAFQRLADPDALEDHSECRGAGLLDCSARVEDDFAMFRARYTEFNRTAKIVRLSVDGEPVRAQRWSLGRPLGGSPLSHTVELGKDRKPVAFALETEEGSCEAQAVPRRERRKYNPRRRRSD